LTEGQIRDSLLHGHAYVSHDWLCDPEGFFFIAENNLGVFDMGDPVPLMNNTRLRANFPVPAKIKLIHNGAVIAEASDTKFNFMVKEQGAYRLEAWLTVDGEDRPWIYSNPVYVGPPPSTAIPAARPSEKVEVRKDIAYAGDDDAKHKLDLYLPKGAKDYPVMVFLHGGSWRSGDRSLYAPLGIHFAENGIAVAIPSYRLMPKSPHPAQIEDSAAAFAWVFNNIAAMGGDLSRLYVAGHSAGGHLAALLALDPRYLKARDIPTTAIHGVASLSGIYDVSTVAGFTAEASPIRYIHAKTPPFLVTYCQWDYFGLPEQARDFAAELKRGFTSARLVYIPGESHISEIVNSIKDGDPTSNALLDFIK
jgi:acetyl esterase/lipase